MVEGRRTLWLFWGSLAVFLLTAHAAVRSPDAEILFEACDALASRGTFALEPVSAWEGHGVETGRDGRTYSIFGPLVSIACAPLLALIDAIGPLAVFEALGGPPWPSHYVPDGLFQALDGEPPTDLLPHARRALVAWIFNGVVSALAVALFFRVARRFAADERAALSVTVVFALATPTWPYAGTFFAEPLATLLVLAAIERMGLPGAARGLRLAVAGLFAGLAAWAHITAVLFAPFFPFLASLEEGRFRPARALVFGTGLALGLGGLALYHYLLWGDPFETGRYSNYGRFVPPLARALRSAAVAGEGALSARAGGAARGVGLRRVLAQVPRDGRDLRRRASCAPGLHRLAERLAWRLLRRAAPALAGDAAAFASARPLARRSHREKTAGRSRLRVRFAGLLRRAVALRRRRALSYPPRATPRCARGVSRRL